MTPKPKSTPTTALIWGSLLCFVIAVVAWSVGEILYNTSRHDLSEKDRSDIRHRQVQIMDAIERIEKRVGFTEIDKLK